MVRSMDNTNLIIVGIMFIVVVVSQFIQANMLMRRYERLERVILFMAGTEIVDDDPPWEAETKPAIDERDFG